MYEYKIIRFKTNIDYNKTKEKYNKILIFNVKDGWRLIQPKTIHDDLKEKEIFIELVFEKEVYKIRL